MNKIVCILGPTASGKSNLGIMLAKRMETEIISGDAFQVYRGMDIGTAKISKEEQGQVRHHMIDILNPTESFDAMQFKLRADPLIDDLQQKGKIPLIVGGTGFYVQTLLYGLDHKIGKVPEIRKKWEDFLACCGKEALYRRLQDNDPETAARLSENDTRRVIRALEIFEATGRKMSEKRAPRRQSFRDPYIFALNLERSVLYQKINLRVEEMFEKGLLQEVERLTSFVPADAQSMQAIGYKEIVSYFRGELTLPECKDLVKRHTRNYAKRQIAFLKRMDPFWLDASLPMEENVNKIIKYLNIRSI